MPTSLTTLAQKLQQLYKLRPFSGTEMKTIREEFRLAYNYNSNHIEGNSLTMQETRSLLLVEIDSSATKAVTEKRKRDEKEMLGHDKAVEQLKLLDKLNFAEIGIKTSSKVEISHKLIKELNKIILVEDYNKRVIDENGDQFFEEVKVGQYKTKNNHVKRRDGSIFKFANVSETQALMTDLINRYEKNKADLHPIVLASMFHYKFIRIHPFDDGNGRVCRLLVNMILMNAGYPLFIVPTNQKDEYYDLLEYLDKQFTDLYEVITSNESEKFEPLTDYIAKRVMWSIDKMIKVRSMHTIIQELKKKLTQGIWASIRYSKGGLEYECVLMSFDKEEFYGKGVNENGNLQDITLTEKEIEQAIREKKDFQYSEDNEFLGFSSKAIKYYEDTNETVTVKGPFSSKPEDAILKEGIPPKSSSYVIPIPRT